MVDTVSEDTSISARLLDWPYSGSSKHSVNVKHFW